MGRGQTWPSRDPGGGPPARALVGPGEQVQPKQVSAASVPLPKRDSGPCVPLFALSGPGMRSAVERRRYPVVLEISPDQWTGPENRRQDLWPYAGWAREGSLRARTGAISRAEATRRPSKGGVGHDHPRHTHRTGDLRQPVATRCRRCARNLGSARRGGHLGSLSVLVDINRRIAVRRRLRPSLQL